MHKKNRTFNFIVNVLLIVITVWGSFVNGWFNWANLMSWLGVIGVILIAYGKQENFIFNLSQNVLNIIISGMNGLFGDMFMAFFYMITQVLGIQTWKENRDEEGNLIIDKKTDWLVTIGAILVGGFLLGFVSWRLGGAYIILDAFNNSTAIIAQYQQIVKRKRSSWILWGITNVVGIVIWTGVGVPQVAIMYLVFSINSVRGYVNWGTM